MFDNLQLEGRMKHSIVIGLYWPCPHVVATLATLLHGRGQIQALDQPRWLDQPITPPMHLTVNTATFLYRTTVKAMFGVQQAEPVASNARIIRETNFLL